MNRITVFSLFTLLALCFSQLAPAQGNKEATDLARQGTEAAKNGDWDKAVGLFRKATALDRKNAPNLVAALQQRGAADMNQQRFAEAAADFTEAIKINSRDSGIYERRAYVEMKLNEYDKALADYSEAIKLNPNNDRYYLLRSYIYETKGDIKASMADTEKVLKLDKQNAEALSRKERLQKIQAMNAAQQPPPAPTKPGTSPHSR